MSKYQSGTMTETPNTGITKNWECSNSTVLVETCIIGARHIQDGTVCQDAIKTHCCEDGLIVVAVADGHGDKKHALSHIGSQLAVSITVKLMEDALRDVVQESYKNTHHIQEELQFQLPKRIHYEWKQLVRNEIAKSNIQEENIENENWDEQVILYGTTILGMGFFQGYMLCFQLGDGDIFLLTSSKDDDRDTDVDASLQQLYSDQEIQQGKVQFLLGKDDLYGSLTYSLCQPNNQNMAQVYFARHPNPCMVSLSSDGLRDCVGGSDEDFERVMRWIYQKLESEPHFASQLPLWLSKVSQQGNGDDISLIVVNINHEIKIPVTTS